jgi:hypothetical protein
LLALVFLLARTPRARPPHAHLSSLSPHLP